MGNGGQRGAGRTPTFRALDSPRCSSPPAAPPSCSAAQLATSCRWPDSDLPRDLEQIKVIVNIAGATATSIVAALSDVVVAVEANETTALQAAGQKKLPSYSEASVECAGSTGRRRCVTFDAELIDINMKEDQAQMAFALPVP